MKNQQFSNLMNQLSSDAVQERVDEEQAQRRRNLIRAVCKTSLLFVLAALAVSGFYYRREIGLAPTDLVVQLPAKPGIRSKLQDLSQKVEKHNELVDQSMK